MFQVTNSENKWVVLTGVFVIAIILLLVARPADVFAQTSVANPSTQVLPRDGQASRSTDSSKQNREAKPELILQTAENNFGVSRLVFSPDGQLLVTTSPRNGLVRLWEIATGRELRNLTSGTPNQASSPFVAFSWNSHLIATAADHHSIYRKG